LAAWFVFKDWPLRAKMMALVLAASLLPLGIATWISVTNARADEYADSATLLGARAEELVGRIDTFNEGYMRSVQRLARVPGLPEILSAPATFMQRMQVPADAVLRLWPSTDGNIRGVALLDGTGKVVLGTEPALVAANLSHRGFVQAALAGENVVSDVFVAEPGVGARSTIAFAAPVHGRSSRLLGVAVLWVEATALHELLREADGSAGPGSSAVLFDRQGIRLAHSSATDSVFHPGIQLSTDAISRLVAEERFGTRTRELLQQPLEMSGPFMLGSRMPPDSKPFRGFSPEDGQWQQVVARTCASVDWSVYYMRPERLLEAGIAQLVREKLAFAGVIALAAVALGGICGALLLKPLGRLAAAAGALGAGGMDTRVHIDRRDELGQLGATFNTMAARIQEQSAALQRESEAQYRQLFGSMSEGFCTIDVLFDDHGNPTDWRFVEVNRAFEQHAGFRAEPGVRMREIYPDIEDYWIRTYGQVARTGKSITVEEESTELGRHFFVSAYRVGGPGSCRVAVLFKDISERRTAQRRLQAQFENLDLLRKVTRAIGERQDLPSIFQIALCSLEESLPMDFGCICLLDPAEGCLIVSQAGARSQPLAAAVGLAEQARVKLVGSGLEHCAEGRLVHESDMGNAQHGLAQRLAAAGLKGMVAAPMLVENQVFGVLIAARQAARRFSGAECEFLRQISEHVALAAHHAQLFTALQAAYEDLQRTQQSVLQHERLRALGQMASGIAHDINNAISPAALYADSLLDREKSLSEQGRQQLLTVQRAIHDVAETVARMREFYRPRSPGMQPQPVQLNELVPQVLELTRAHWSHEAEQRGVVIEARTELAAQLPPITGSQSEMREAMTNLVLNAADAMPEGGTMTLRTRRAPQGEVIIEVCDTGVGMDEDSRRRCLEPFFTTKGERGTGLGLAMVYGIAQRHGALLEIDSEPGWGTTVRMSFRAAA
jgi:signal transduction histidine kinase